MNGQICKTCFNEKDPNCYCSPNSCCSKYIPRENKDEDNFNDILIKSSNNSGVTREQIFNAFSEKGLMGVYNLGTKHMYEYLKSTSTLGD